jgi:formate-dependent phosphoribosylglycinamide formyltransferase (GAR transformylase)
MDMSNSDRDSTERTARRPRILLTDSNRWAITARMAIEFRKLDCEVAVVCRMPGHPVEKLSGIQNLFPYRGRAPVDSLRIAIDAFHPDMVVPANDRDVRHLHQLHAVCTSLAGADQNIAGLIERSLGSPAGFPITSSRHELLALAQKEGIAVPRQASIQCEGDLDFWRAQAELPWVMKADGTSEGKGVRFVEDAEEAREFFREYSRPEGAGSLAKKLLLNRDWQWVASEWKHSQRSVVAQTVIRGRPANCAVVCWQGEVLAGAAVEAVKTRGKSGPASLVQVVEGAEMMAAAKKIARCLGVSGFFGLDFVIEEDSEVAYLIEMNPRCTPPCALPLGEGHNMVAALWSRLTGRPIPRNLPAIEERFIAYFPQTVENGGNLVGTGHDEPVYFDIPKNEVELVRNILHPRPVRSTLGRMVDKARRGKRQEVAAIQIVKRARGPMPAKARSETVPEAAEVSEINTLDANRPLIKKMV